jgi:hypothetical protein
MIFRPAQIYQMRLGRPVTPANFGGDSDSDSSTSTSNLTTNNVSSIDKRSVASDEAVSLSGDNSSIDRSSTTSFLDQSNRSTTNLTTFIDQSTKDNSTHFSDTSDRSTNFLSDSSLKNSNNTSFVDSSVKTSSSNTSTTTNNTSTDYGSVSGALTLAGSMTTKAFGLAGYVYGGAVDALKQTSKDSQSNIMAAFGAAASSQSSSAAVLGFASDAIKQTGAAFAESKDGGQSKMMVAAIAAVAVVGVAFALR